MLPSLVGDTNGGKGVPIKFTLTPLETIKKWFKLESRIHVIYKSIKIDRMKRIIQVTQDMEKTKQKLNDFHQDIQKGLDSIADDDICEVTSLVQKFETFEAVFREDLKSLVKQIRGGTEDISKLDGLIQNLESSPFSPKGIDEEIKKWKQKIEKSGKQVQASG